MPAAMHQDRQFVVCFDALREHERAGLIQHRDQMCHRPERWIKGRSKSTSSERIRGDGSSGQVQPASRFSDRATLDDRSEALYVSDVHDGFY